MIDVAGELKARYPDRIVIYHLPPVSATDDMIAFLRNADCCLMVVEEQSTRRQEFDRALELANGYHLIGTVPNKPTQRRASSY